MEFKKILISLAAILTISITAQAQTSNMMDELDPFDPNIAQTLEKMDQQYQEETGTSPFAGTGIQELLQFSAGCSRKSCPVYAQVSRSRQMLYLYQSGSLIASWPASTGLPGHDTPDFDTHPNGRVYDSYTSSKYPGGDYNGLGNMPYAVFISGGFAIHGTGQGNWPKLGQRASHGCIRIHPDNAYKFNRMVRQVGVANVWITVQP